MAKKKKKTSPHVAQTAEGQRLYLGALVVLTLVVFFPVFGHEFLNFDDDILLYENLQITQNQSVSILFQEKLWSPHYKPLVYLSWLIEYKLFGLNPTVFHATNLLLHIANVLLVFLCTRTLFARIKWGKKTQRNNYAWLVAALFAIHPMRVESVAWIAERKDVLFAFFFLLGLLSYLKYLGAKLPNKKWLALSALCYLGSILSKSPGIMMLPILFILDYVCRRPISKKLLLEKIPHFAVFLLALVLFGVLFTPEKFVVGLVEGGELVSLQMPSNLSGLSPFLTKILVINWRLWAFFLHLIIPINLAAIYPRLAILEVPGALIYLMPILTILVAYLIFKWRSTKPFLIFSFLFFLIAILPAIALAETGTNTLSDRYTYLPGYGVFLLLALSIRALLDRRPSINRRWWQISGALIVILSIACHFQVRVWKNSETLWTNAIEKYPNNPFAFNGRASHYLETGDIPKAQQDLEHLTQLSPDFHQGFLNLGRVYRMQKQYAKALEMYNRAIALNSEYAEAFVNRGNVYLDLKNLDQAEKDYQRCIEIQPTNLHAITNLGSLYAMRKQLDLAMKQFSLSLSINPQFLNALKGRTLVQTEQGLKSEALMTLDQLLAIDPTNQEMLILKSQLMAN